MKVFTVGLEQKPPMEETKSAKSDSPPPGYSTTEARIPLPLGPELPRAPMPPTPILVRKSRGYKGILLVMLSVFLMAVFALVLSEMAYNRQRDENFFKLRWAELKHRMGYEDGPFEYYQRAAASIGDKFDRMLNLAKSNEMPSAPIVQSLQVEEEPSTSTTTSAPPPTPEPIVAIDSFPMAPGSGSSSGSSSRSSQASFEIEPPQPIFGGAGLNALNQFRDARLQFLRNILQKIKQHAEDIGFDGTMQVSIIEVEPQNGATNGETEENANGNGPIGMGAAGWPPQRQLILSQPQQQFPPQMPPQIPPLHFFPHPRPLIEDFKNSRSFLDGFGEFHQPQQQFMQNNQVNEPEERPRMFGPWAAQPNDFPPPPPPMMQQQNFMENPDFMENMPRWGGPRFNPFRPPTSSQQQQPEMLFFHPIFPQQMSLRFPPIMPPQQQLQQQQQGPPEWAQPPQQQQGPLPRPAAFDRWSGQSQQQAMGEQQQQLPAQQSVQQPQQQQPLQPQPAAVQQPQIGGQQQPQIQIDFPEVKPPMVAESSAEDKFPVAPPHPQPQKPDWLPKWLFESPGVVNNNAGGPPAQQPAEMVKFPSVTVLEPAGQVDGQKMVADNENRGETGSDQVQQDSDTQSGPKVVDSAKGESGPIGGQQPADDVIEVDAAPQQSEQQQNQQQQQQPQSQQGQDSQREQQPAAEQAQQQQPTIQMQKWFPEVPSVFFQVDDPNEASAGAQQVQNGQQQQQSEQQPQQQGTAEH